jgi:hypothetical protein
MSEQSDIANEIAGRLRGDGVHLSGKETPDELVRILEAVERFEAAVRRAGGDLMVDEPVGNGAPIDPDDRAFVLPSRQNQESVGDFLGRISEATERAGKRKSK